MSITDHITDPKAFAGANQFPHFIAGKLYMTAAEYLADFDKPATGNEGGGNDEGQGDESDGEAKDLRAKLKAADVKGWGPRTKLEDLRKLAEGL